MQLAPGNSVVVYGILQRDGTVRLDRPLGIQPGPIELTIRPIPPRSERLPDLPFDDLCEAPPFDLPRSGVTWAVQPIRVLQRLPDPVQSVEVA